MVAAAAVDDWRVRCVRRLSVRPSVTSRSYRVASSAGRRRITPSICFILMAGLSADRRGLLTAIDCRFGRTDVRLLLLLLLLLRVYHCTHSARCGAGVITASCVRR